MQARSSAPQGFSADGGGKVGERREQPGVRSLRFPGTLGGLDLQEVQQSVYLSSFLPARLSAPPPSLGRGGRRGGHRRLGNRGTPAENWNQGREK